MNRSFHFLRTPKWLALIGLIVVLVTFMLILSRWQFDRLDERREENAQMNAGLVLPVAPIDLVALTSESWAFRAVSATGEYSSDSQTLVEGRSLNNDPGMWVLAPLDLDSGGSVLIMRGWIPVDSDVPPVPGGLISVEGVLLPGEHQRNVGPQDDEATEVFTRVNLDLIGRKSERSFGELYLQLTTADTQLENGPTLLATPVVDGEGPHKGYALQWLGFSLTAVVGLFALIRNEAGKRAIRQ